MDALLEPEALLSLVTLSLMEIVLGIDTIVFISILVAKLPMERQTLARRLGLSLALVIRLGLLGTIQWVMGLTPVLFTVLGRDITGRKLIFLGGGLFLIAKSTHEIYEKLEGEEAQGGQPAGTAGFGTTLVQILLLIGVMLVAEGLGQHISKGDIYFAMAFSLLVEVLNMRPRKRQQPVQLHDGTRRLVKPA